MGKPWKPGSTPYKDYLDSLSKEEYDAHLKERARRKAMRKAMETIVKEQQVEWLTMLNNAAVVMAQQALEKGDVQAFIAVWDRIIGKPKDTIEVEDNNKPLPWNDDFDE